MNLEILGTFCFGLVVGWIVNHTLSRRGEKIALSAVAAVIGIVGGGAVSASFSQDQFPWYGIGVVVGAFAFVIVSRSLRDSEGSWLGGVTASTGPTSFPRARLRLRTVTGRLDAIILDNLRGLVRPDLEVEISRPRVQPRAERPKPPARYANATLLDGPAGFRLSPETVLYESALYRLRLDIGPLSPESHVIATGGLPLAAFPDDRLPSDIDLDVVVSSTDFDIARNAEGPYRRIAQDRFFLPGDGSPASGPNSQRFLDFYLLVRKKSGLANARICYYYNNVLVQSQLLSATIGKAGGFRIVTDFTLADGLTGFEEFPSHPRISILTNANGDGTHQIVLRQPGALPGGPGQKSETFSVPETKVGDVIAEIRKELRDRAPTRRRRSKADLKRDLEVLAPKGFDLWTQVPGQKPYIFAPLLQDPASCVIQVCRPTSSGFVFPWALIYDIPINVPNPALCKFVADWDEKSPLVKGDMRSCPHGPHKENVLCPFGFWGFRYSIDQLSSTDESVFVLAAADACKFVVAETQYDVDKNALAAHVKKLGATLNNVFPSARIVEGADKSSIRLALGQDLPIVYFYCHGNGRYSGDPDTYLGVGMNESIKAQELIGWVQSWLIGGARIWDKVRPLVFINACNGLEIYPTTLVSYLNAFVGSARAAGVIGTEAKVNQALAMEVAEQFFDLLLTRKLSVDEAMRAIRLDFLSSGNLLGLFYTSYCWSELRLPAATKQAALA